MCLWARPMPMWWSRLLWRMCDGACFVDAVVADSEVGCVACLARFGFGEPVVDGGWCGASEGCGGGGCGCRCAGESGQVERGLESFLVEVCGQRVGAVRYFLRVCWKRSTFPQVVGWLGAEFFCSVPR